MNNRDSLDHEETVKKSRELRIIHKTNVVVKAYLHIFSANPLLKPNLFESLRWFFIEFLMAALLFAVPTGFNRDFLLATNFQWKPLGVSD